MAKYAKEDFRPAREWIDAMPGERRERIEAGAAEIIENLHLREIRKALSATQEAVAERSGLKQAEVSRIESNPEVVQLRTLSKYASGLGGRVKLVVEFPDGTLAEMPMRGSHPVKSKLRIKRNKHVGRPAAPAAG